jgi:peptide chain release factor 1
VDVVPDARTGHQTLTMTVVGDGASAFDSEAGGHRIQRVPSTERRGRVHSSTVTVAVLGGGSAADLSRYRKRSEDDFEVQWFSGSGAGGQNRNKVMACCRIRHLPTGLVRTAQTRSRENSQRLAMEAMLAELDRAVDSAAQAATNVQRRDQVGSGERSDRRRLWAFQRDVVEDYRTGRRTRCSDAMKGRLDSLWP